MWSRKNFLAKLIFQKMAAYADLARKLPCNFLQNNFLICQIFFQSLIIKEIKEFSKFGEFGTIISCSNSAFNSNSNLQSAHNSRLKSL